MCSEGRLAIVWHMPIFAPGHESFEYVVRGENIPPNSTLFAKFWGSGAADHDEGLWVGAIDDKVSGTFERKYRWNGRADNGDCVHPGLSPFRVAVFCNGASDARDFLAIFTRIELVLGPWTHPELPSDANRAVRARLNALGYYGGPSKADALGYQAKAVERFRRHHLALGEPFAAGVTPALEEALKDEKVGQPWLVVPGGKAPAPGAPLAGTPLRVYVEAAVYSKNPPSDGIGPDVHELSDQYVGGKSKHDRELARLNRPIVPLQCRLYLLDSRNREVPAGEGAGPAQIRWSATQPDPDLGLQHPDDGNVGSFPRRYLDKALRCKNGGPGQMNCHADFGGIRGAPAPADEPFWLGDHYLPYASVLAGNAVLSTAIFDPALQSCVGTTGIYFRPSFVAGDRYKVRAELCFDGHPRALSLAQANQVAAQETGVIEVWRQAKIAAVIGWPEREWKPALQALREEYARAYLEIDTSDVKKKPPTEIMTQREYEQFFLAMQGICDVMFAGQPLIVKKKSNDAMLTPNPKGGADLLTTLAGLAVGKGETEELILAVASQVQKDLGRGLVIIDRAMLPQDKRFKQDPSNQKSEGLPDGIVLLDQLSVMPLSILACHESGHCFWLRHTKDVDERSKGPDHDDADTYCMMRYPDWSQQDERHHLHEKSFRPRFCGRCNLKLRGWDVLAQGIPDDST
jgi:hypothetical protein